MCWGTIVKADFSPVHLMKQNGADIYAAPQSARRDQVAKSTSKRKEYTKDDVKVLKAHSRARTPVAKLSKLMKRSEGALRQKALALGIGLGHQR